jgi:hypothetical protein
MTMNLYRRPTLWQLAGVAGCWHAVAGSATSRPEFLPVIGVKSLEQLDEALSTRALPKEDVVELERLVPRDRVVGSRYGEAPMRQLDSER